jgi:NAD(P)H-dependent FMN reductase
MNADVDVATDNTLQSLVCPTTSTSSATRRRIEVSKSRRWHRFHKGHKSSADEEPMTATTRNTKTVSAMTNINVLIIVGLRAASINRELAKVATDCSEDGIALNMFDSLTDLPRYSETFENRGTPSSVGALRTAAAEADAVLIVTTYHGRVPAVVHNAIDWLTRRWDQAALHDKPLAVIGRASGCYSGVWSHQTEDADRIAGPRVIESITVSNLREAIKKLACEVHAGDAGRYTDTIAAAHQPLR